ncbi:MAG: adenylate kinase [Fimbriimonadaceae bacterium]|jgi:adenylate kinase|nr:adenylate kinase [Fimbriimonadaceae bacterium]
MSAPEATIDAGPTHETLNPEARPVRLILIGPPGVGKGTQAALLQERLGIVPLSSGVIFRSEIDADTDLGHLAQSYIKRGELVPSGITIEMMRKRIGSDNVRKHGFILDGFPRNLRQAEALDEMLDEMEINLDKVISLDVADEVVIQRLSGRIGCTKCGEIYHSTTKPPKREGLCDKCNSTLIMRSDDQPETIKERLRVFHEQTAPVRDFYEAKGLLQRVDGTRTPEEVYQQIVAGVDP